MTSFRKNLKIFLMKHGNENTPQYIGPTECANRTIVAMAKCMLKAQKLEKSLWMEEVANAVCTLNRCPTRALCSIILEETWSGRRPYVAHMRVYRSLVYAMVMDEKRDNLMQKGTKCVFFGYCKGMKAYRVICLETNKIIK